MNDENNNGQKGGLERWCPCFLGVCILMLVAVVLVWMSSSLTSMPLFIECLALLAVFVSARLAIGITCWCRKRNDGQSPEHRIKKWLSVIDPWLVGLVVFIVGFVSWTYLVPFLVAVLRQSNGENPWKVDGEANEWGDYSQGLALLALAGLTAGFTYWRGQQAKEQIEKAQKQIKEAQRQARFQSFDSIVQMAVDNSNLGRQVAGWERLRLWCDHVPENPEKEDLEDWITFLEVIRRISRKVSASPNVLIAAHRLTSVHKGIKKEAGDVGNLADLALKKLQGK